ncbi:hypothetical protein DPMN_025734 [Dreissena polymorpha]|uniref:Uncharacterized protein n=1 Tax=Dreissena polymorpha TaxID=45954 RepID=A0A9D4LPT6_DREPO|nr:hypothetical protein DPMN_025734 [Dreissena polymorpha]
MQTVEDCITLFTYSPTIPWSTFPFRYRRGNFNYILPSIVTQMCSFIKLLDPKLFTAHFVLGAQLTHIATTCPHPKFSNWVDGNHKHTLNTYALNLSPYRSYIELTQQLWKTGS